MNVHRLSDDAQRRVEILIRPNRSLPPPAMAALVVALAGVALTIGLGFWAIGAVLILPFAGLEVLLVGTVFWLLYRHHPDYELIVIEHDRVRIIRSSAGKESREGFQRYWVRVRTAPQRGGQLPRVLLGSHGHFVEVGSALDGPQRAALARELKEKLHPPAH